MNKTKKNAPAVIEETPQDNTPKALVALGLSLLQLVLAFFLYMSTALQPVILVLLAVLAAAGVWLGWKLWGKKRGTRVAMRAVCYALILGPFAFLLFSVFTDIGINWALYQQFISNLRAVFEYALFLLCVFIQSILLAVLPAMAAATRHGHGFDRVTLRVFAIAQLVLALITCLFVAGSGNLVMGAGSVIFGVLFCVTCALTVAASFGLLPAPAGKKADK